MATKLRQLRINRVAHVDKGAGEGVEILLMKRADPIDDSEYEALTKRTFTADERKKAEESGAAMPGGRYPIENVSDLENAIHAVGRGKGSHDAIRAHIVARAKALGASDKIPDDWTKSVGKMLAEFVKGVLPDLSTAQIEAIEKADVSAILAEDTDGDVKMFDQLAGMEQARQGIWNANSAVCTSIQSIVEDDEVDGPGKLALLQETLQEYTTHMLTLVGGALAKSSARTPEGDEKPMSEAVAKALGLAADASEADILAKLSAITKMSEKHKAFMEKGKMPAGGKDAFAAMTPDERDAHMAKSGGEPDADDVGKSASAIEKAIKDGEAFRTPEGVVVTKREAGALFDVMKAQNDHLIADRVELAKMRDAADIIAITKRVEPITANIGKADEIATLLHGIGKSDQKAADQVEALLKVADERIAKSKLFEEMGSGHRGGGDATQAINAQAAELVSKARAEGKTLTIEKARTEVRDANPQLAEQERAQSRPRAA